MPPVDAHQIHTVQRLLSDDGLDGCITLIISTRMLFADDFEAITAGCLFSKAYLLLISTPCSEKINELHPKRDVLLSVIS